MAAASGSSAQSADTSGLPQRYSEQQGAVESDVLATLDTIAPVCEVSAVGMHGLILRFLQRKCFSKMQPLITERGCCRGGPTHGSRAQPAVAQWERRQHRDFTRSGETHLAHRDGILLNALADASRAEFD
jgi:hypothetical protein